VTTAPQPASVKVRVRSLEEERDDACELVGQRVSWCAGAGLRTTSSIGSEFLVDLAQRSGRAARAFA
jgi:hypothetical protein